MKWTATALGALACVCLSVAVARESPPPMTAERAAESGFIGLLRARDLTPFGLLRLDMRPAHAVYGTQGKWGAETELAYQNTWATSGRVEGYLKSLPGRREIGPAEVQAIRDLPGENFLVDLELAQLDFTLHYRFSSRWQAYAAFSAISYHGGFLDRTIEGFHDLFSFSNFGRPAAARNNVNVILDLKSAQIAELHNPTRGGLLDPTLGLRFSGARWPRRWNLVLEVAAKLPVQGHRPFLSSGRTDFGFQASVQRFGNSHALYASVAAVYYDGSLETPTTQPQIVPTLVIGYEKRFSPRWSGVLQGYASTSVYSHEETDLEELLDNKYQLSLGVRRRSGRGLFSFAITENLQNFNNTPDVGFQLGWACSPALAQ